MAEGLEIRVVLVRPRNPLNIGAAARAMANFGFEDLAVVDPYEPVWRETKSAVGAEALVLKARAVKTLEEAVEDRHLVLGATAVRERRLEKPIVRLPDLAAFLGKQKSKDPLRVALLFGQEKTGLTREHLESCNAYVTIPASSSAPSMNLSHAVAVCCYELSRKARGFPAKGALLATAGDRERLVNRALELFDQAGYLKGESPVRKARLIRETLLQWRVRAADVRLLHGIFRYLTARMKENRAKA